MTTKLPTPRRVVRLPSGNELYAANDRVIDVNFAQHPDWDTCFPQSDWVVLRDFLNEHIKAQNLSTD